VGIAQPPQILPFVRAVRLRRNEDFSCDGYPFALPAIRQLERLELHPHVTFLVGENGSGKSTLLEAIAIKAGFNAEGGSRNFRFASKETHSALNSALVLERSARRPTDGFFLRAESFYTLANEIDRLDLEGPGFVDFYGGKSLHEQSHGEAFLSLLKHRLRGNGLYLFDEPEAALSPARQLSVLVLLHELVLNASQFVIATHSPLLMAYPFAKIIEVSATGLREIAYTDTEHFQVTRDFLLRHERMLGHLLDESGAAER
jgi:predicted ATPase